MKPSVVLLALLVASASSFAGQQTGKITSIYTRIDNLIAVTLDGVATGHPACATHPYWLIKDENTISGKNQYSMLLAAQAQNKSIMIEGNNTCTRWSDGEDIRALELR